jgi:hypothetical protein
LIYCFFLHELTRFFREKTLPEELLVRFLRRRELNGSIRFFIYFVIHF